MTSIFQTLELDVQTEIKNLEQFFEVDLWPFVKEFFAALLSQTGAVAVKAAVDNLPEIVTGNESVAVAAVAAAVASSLAANAAADAQTALANAQAAIAAGAASTTVPNAAPEATPTPTTISEPSANAPDGESAT